MIRHITLGANGKKPSFQWPGTTSSVSAPVETKQTSQMSCFHGGKFSVESQPQNAELGRF